MVLCLGLVFYFFCPAALRACECAWGGPFLKVACSAPLVVRGKIRSHAEGKKGTPPSVEVDVLETLKGTEAKPSLRIWGDTGNLCRADPRQFPVGSEWLLALDGPGSKPAMTPDHALSLCGQFWLEVREGQVVGNIDSEQKSSAAQETPLARFRERLKDYSCRESFAFTAEASAGKPFLRYFGAHFAFQLKPVPQGWLLSVTDQRGTEDISRLTPPFHSVPNPREIEGWHFRNADNTGPNEPGDKNVNAPGAIRTFIFSPEVGQTIDGPAARSKPDEKDMERIRQFGQGTLTILDYRLKDLEPGKQAGFEWMRFKLEISWRQAARP